MDNAPTVLEAPWRARLVDCDGFGPLPSQLRTIRELVSHADVIPAPRVIEAIIYYTKRLSEVPVTDNRQRGRYLIVIGALANRGAFEIVGLPKNPDHVVI